MNGGDASVLISEGCGITDPSKAGFADAIAAATAAEAVVMMMGLDTANVEKEGHDRTSLGLPGVQLDLIKAVVAAVGGKTPIILVLLNGGAVALDWAKDAGNTDAMYVECRKNITSAASCMQYGEKEVFVSMILNELVVF
jgi:beta-glucosidase